MSDDVDMVRLVQWTTILYHLLRRDISRARRRTPQGGLLDDSPPLLPPQQALPPSHMVPPQQMLPPHMLQAFYMLPPMPQMFSLPMPSFMPYMQPPMPLMYGPPYTEPMRATTDSPTGSSSMASAAAASAGPEVYTGRPQLYPSSSGSVPSAIDPQLTSNGWQGDADDRVNSFMAQHQPWALGSTPDLFTLATRGQHTAGALANETATTASPQSIIAAAVKEANVSLRRIRAGAMPTTMKRQRDVSSSELLAGAQQVEQQDEDDIIQINDACTELMIHAPKKHKNIK